MTSLRTSSDGKRSKTGHTKKTEEVVLPVDPIRRGWDPFTR